MFDAGIRMGVRRQFFKRIKRDGFVTGFDRVISHRAKRSGNDNALNLCLERSSEEITRTNNVALEDFPLVSDCRGKLSSTVVNVSTTSNCGDQGFWLSQITEDGFYIQSVECGVVASFTKKRTHGMPVVQQSTNEISPKMTTSTSNQYHEIGNLRF